MGAKPKYILQVMVSVDQAVEDEWNEWYNNVHIPDLLECPGWYSARRYESVAGASVPKYATLYEVEDEAVVESDLFQQRRGWSKFENHVRASHSFYKQIFPEDD